ncbi:decarboxylase [Staphylococcus pseudintermedius]|nr:decarboxylase [Staphylococcus pseudintermedius]
MIIINIYRKCANQFSTPLYIYNIETINSNYKYLKDSLPEDSDIYYSLKANSNDVIVKSIIQMGAGAEVSSLNELNIAINNGTDPNNILYTGPGKTDYEIHNIIKKDVGCVSIETLEELKCILYYSHSLNKEVSILIRLNPEYKPITNTGIRMTAISSQFGFDISVVSHLMRLIKESKCLIFKGFHIFNGSNINDENELIENFKENIRISYYLSEEFEIPLKTLNIGGGFPAPYGQKGEVRKFYNLKAHINDLMVDLFGDTQPRLIFESGRYIVGTSGILLGEVQAIKNNKNDNYLILDYGINAIGGMSAIGRLPTTNYDFISLSSNEDEDREKSIYKVVGPLCTPMDYISRRVELNSLKRGEILGIPNVGAYSLSASLINFLSRDLPTEVIVKGEKIISASKLKITRHSVSTKGGDANG